MSGPKPPMFGSDEPVAMLAEAAVRLVMLAVLLVWRLLRFAVRRPRFASAVTALVLLDRYAGHLALLVLLGVLAIAVVAWGVVRRHALRGQVRPSLHTAWVRLTLRRRWRRIASRVGLVVPSHRGPGSGWVHGAIGDVRVTRAGIVRLRIAIPTGLTLDDYTKRADALAVAFGVREVRVTAAGSSSVWVELHRADVLAETIPPLPILAEPQVNLAGIPVGRHEDGTDWLFTLYGTHILIAGATGAGKGSVLWSLLRGLSQAIDAGWVQVWAIDPKGGMELRPGQALFSRFEDATPEAMCDLLEDLVAVMDTRAKTLAARGVRKHQASVREPHVLAVIDELATLTAFAERDTVRRIDRALGLLLTKGRAVGITVLAAVQDPGKDVVGWRDLFPTRIAMRLDNPLQVDMVLGDGARDLGASADHISENTPGVAYVRVEGTRAIRRARASFLTDDDIANLARTVKATPALTAPRPLRPVDPLDSFAPVDHDGCHEADRPGPQKAATPDRPASQRKPRKPRASRAARTTQTSETGGGSR
jgi:DNA segregation ATPase FtsK/SpoIIIE, S-DNA-T family